ncbi:MAG: EF-hand domain-containing protein [Verrucomicrobiota bacterium]
MNKTIAMTLGAVLGSGMLLHAQPGEGISEAPKRDRKEGAHRMKTTPEELKKFDKNADGKLDQEERKALNEHRRMERLKKFDTNGDGKLDKEETEKFREARKAAQEKRDAAREELKKKLIEKYDTDKDGKLSKTEREAIPHRKHGKRGNERKDKAKQEPVQPEPAKTE